MRPAPVLRPFIAWYSGYRQTGGPPTRHRGLPSPYMTVIVTLDEPLTLAVRTDGLPGPSSFDVLIGGLHTVPAVIAHDGRQSGIQLALSPLGARALLGLPAGELAGTDVAAVDVLGPLGAELHERVRCATDWPGRFAAVDDVLIRGGRFGRVVAPEVARAWQRLLVTRGAVSVADLAREVGWSPRHLGDRFRTEISLTPKAAARVVRFDRARRLLQARAAEPPALADLAAACGYYDQAHLAREFNALAGCPPSHWMAEEFRNIQGTTATALEDSPA